MAYTFTFPGRAKDTAGIRQRRLVTVAGPSSYATGGIAVTPNMFGLGHIEHIPLFIITDGSAYGICYYNPTTAKLLALLSGDGTPAGTITMDSYTPEGTNSKPSFTVEASGAVGANMDVGLSADSAAATFEGGTGITAQRTLTTTSPVGTPTFAGTPAVLTGTFAGSAGSGTGLTEFSPGTDLSLYIGRVEIIGY